MTSPEEHTVEHWKGMQRNLLEEVQNMLGAYGIPIQDELPWDDIDKIVSGGWELECDFATNLANLGVCAVEIYKLENGIHRCKCGRADIIGTALQCKVCDADVKARREAAGFKSRFD